MQRNMCSNKYEYMTLTPVPNLIWELVFLFMISMLVTAVWLHMSNMVLTSFAVMPSGGLLISVRKQTFWLKKRREYNIMI